MCYLVIDKVCRYVGRILYGQEGQQTMMYSVLIVEDESLELQALTKLVKSHTDRIKSIYQASDSVEALSLARAHMPDILLLDIHIPGSDRH